MRGTRDHIGSCFIFLAPRIFILLIFSILILQVWTHRKIFYPISHSPEMVKLDLFGFRLTDLFGEFVR